MVYLRLVMHGFGMELERHERKVILWLNLSRFGKIEIIMLFIRN